MWVRVDDTAPLHPKFCRAGVAAAGWWLHALAYCNRGLTDGFIPGKDVIFVSPFTPPAQTLELVEILVRERLLERQNDDFVMHDYPEYQLSREEVLALREERIESGRKGGRNSGKSRRERAKQQLEAKAKQQLEAKAKHAANPLLSSPHPVVSGSSSGLPATNNTLEVEQEQARKEARKPSVVLTDDQFMAALRANEAYKHLDLDEQLGRMDAWLSTRPGRQKTRRFIVGWLNRQDRPINDNGNSARAMKTRTDMSGLRAFAEKRSQP